MDPEASAAVPPRRPTPLRVTLAVIVILVLLLFSVAYHDGMFWTDSLNDANAVGPYRFKGIVESYDAANEQITLRDDSAVRTLHWNITTPKPGWYVVDAQVNEDQTLEALALSPVFLFRR